MTSKKTIVEHKKTTYAYINFFDNKFMQKWILNNTPIKEVTYNLLQDLHQYYDNVTLKQLTQETTNDTVRSQYTHLLILVEEEREIRI